MADATPPALTNTPTPPETEAVPPEVPQPDNQPPANKPPQSKKRLLWIVLLALVLLGAAAVARMQLLKDKPEPATSTTETAPEETKKPSEVKIGEGNFIYAHRETSKQPYQLYYRPLDGGDRVSIMKFAKGANFIDTDMADDGTYALLLDTQDVWVGKGTTKPTKVYTLPNADVEQVSGPYMLAVDLSQDGKQILLSVVNGTKDPTLMQVAASGGTAKLVATIDKDKGQAVHLEAWNDKDNVVYFRQGCNNCDGVEPTIYEYDVAGKQRTVFSKESSKQSAAQAPVFNEGQNKLMFTTNTVDKTVKVEDSWEGYYVGYPSKVWVKDLASDKTTEIASIGKKAQKDDQGTYEYEGVGFGWLHYAADTPFYSHGKDVTSVNLNTLKTTTLFTGSSTGNGVWWASNKEVLFAKPAGKDPEVYSQILNLFDVDSQKVTKILETDDFALTELIGAAPKQ